MASSVVPNTKTSEVPANTTDSNNIFSRRRRRSALTDLNNNTSKQKQIANSNTSYNSSNAVAHYSSSRMSKATSNGKDLRVSKTIQSSMSSSKRQLQIKKDHDNVHRIEEQDENCIGDGRERDGSDEERHEQEDSGEPVEETTDSTVVMRNVEQPTSLKRSAPDNNSLQADKKIKIDYAWDDLDEDDIDDPSMVSEYVVEIFQYLHRLELRTLPNPEYLTWQTNLPKMRSILVNWLVQTHLRFKLLPETLYLAINLMDRFFSLETVKIEKFQLLATSCLFTAAKYEEVYSPSLKNYSIVTDNGYTEQEILEAEKAVLEVLNFDLSYPNPMNFLRRISKADEYDQRTRTLGKYLLEITVIDYHFVGITPSLAAAAAMYIARKILRRGPWNNNLIHYSGGYTEEDIAETCNLMLKYLVGPIVHEDFFKKYASRRFLRVSILARQWCRNFVMTHRDMMELLEDEDDFE